MAASDERIYVQEVVAVADDLKICTSASIVIFLFLRTYYYPRKITNLHVSITFSPDRLVAKVTGYLPLTPRNFEGVPKIQDWETYDVRYHSFSTMGKLLYVGTAIRGSKRDKDQYLKCAYHFILFPVRNFFGS